MTGIPTDPDRPPNLAKLLDEATEVAGEGGLYGKYLVYPIEARMVEGGIEEYEAITDCFVLRPANDLAARAALAAYADATENEALAHDLWRWLALLGMRP